MKNIIFLVSGEKKPAGGNKIIYQLSNYINSLIGFTSSIVFIKKKKSKKWIDSINKKFFKKNINSKNWQFQDIDVEKNPFVEWSGTKVNIKKNLLFDKKKDHIILPEIYAHFAADLLIKKKISYSIFVQNGYAIFPTNNIKKLHFSYQHSKFILTCSNDIRICVQIVFPAFKKKIIKIINSVNSKSLLTKIKKENLISFMPRKLRKHSELVINFLRNHLPKGWRIISIENMNEKNVFNIFKKSKIFLSFSELEGLGLPPIEAALAGNKVIGYTGEGGREYWKKPIFEEIKNGDIKKFCNVILKNINQIKDFKNKSKKLRKELSIKYSVSNQRKSILNFLKKLSY